MTFLTQLGERFKQAAGVGPRFLKRPFACTSKPSSGAERVRRLLWGGIHLQGLSPFRLGRSQRLRLHTRRVTHEGKTALISIPSCSISMAGGLANRSTQGRACTFRDSYRADFALVWPDVSIGTRAKNAEGRRVGNGGAGMAAMSMSVQGQCKLVAVRGAW